MQCPTLLNSYQNFSCSQMIIPSSSNSHSIGNLHTLSAFCAPHAHSNNIGNAIIVLYTCTFVGLLPAVENLTIWQDAIWQDAYYVFVSWDPPFTQDITFENPDIIGYCVSVHATYITSADTQMPLDQCENETEILIDSGICYLYMITVIPVNRVGNGTPDNMIYGGIKAGTSV